MPGRLDLVEARQFGAGALRRWIAWTCLLLVLVFSGLEATHAHSSLQRSSDTPCMICVSARAQAPAVVVDALPVLLAIAIVALPYEVQGNSLASRLELFIRPPPSAL
ncbi:MAG TPA: hypothetical protein VG488_11225 [Candidatus Angelobacter sp.]|nr:hypothetical protein [Candidatus Angelobacter sp.]